MGEKVKSMVEKMMDYKSEKFCLKNGILRKIVYKDMIVRWYCLIRKVRNGE